MAQQRDAQQFFDDLALLGSTHGQERFCVGVQGHDVLEQRVAHAYELDDVLLAVTSIALCFICGFFADLALIVYHPAKELRLATTFYLVSVAIELKLDAHGHVLAVDLVD